MILILFLYLNLIKGILSYEFQSVCGIPTGVKSIYAGDESDTMHIITKRQAPDTKLRIHVHYMPEIQSAHNSYELKKNFIEPAVRFWSGALSAKNPTEGTLRISRYCDQGEQFLKMANGSYNTSCSKSCAPVTKCLLADIPEQYLDKCTVYSNRQVYETTAAGHGVRNADFILLVDASQDQYCDHFGFIAYANTCARERTLDRPIAGVLQLCTGNLNDERYSKRMIYNTVRHEMAHALGFSTESFPLLRHRDGSPRTARDPMTNRPNERADANGQWLPNENTISTIHRWWVSAKGSFSRHVQAFTLPTLLDFARKHFNCPTLEGVDLENQGGSGTASTHFETRIAKGDIMTGAVNTLQVVSNLTLAYFYDSGWYNVNFSMAEPWQWGKNLGCDFVEKSCYEYMVVKKHERRSIYPWCDTPNDQQCFPNKNGFGTCNFFKQSVYIEPEFQYYPILSDVDPQDEAFYAGHDDLADYCPTYEPSWSTETKSYASLCFDPKNQKPIDSQGNPYFQSFGKSTVCIKHETNVDWTSTLGEDVPYAYQFNASCHKYRCSPQNGLLLVFNKKGFRCPVRGGVVKINLNDKNSGTKVTGSGICPPCSKLCKKCPRNSASRSQRNRAG